MKKLTILFILISGFMFSQKFILTPENFKNKEDQSKNYIVIDVKGKNKHDLFILVKKIITGNFIKMKSDSYTDIEDEQISFSLYSKNTSLIFLTISGSNIYTLYNHYEINFKDEKLMIKPSYQYLTNFDGYKEFLKDIYSRNESKREKEIIFIEKETNDFIYQINNLISNSTSDW